MTDFLLWTAVGLLGLIAVLLAGILFQSRRQHNELIELLNDLATMMGDAIDLWRDKNG
jgi:hypothetical protein